LFQLQLNLLDTLLPAGFDQQFDTRNDPGAEAPRLYIKQFARIEDIVRVLYDFLLR
jgi:hypothetical protein